jgi:hypothetical protein
VSETSKTCATGATREDDTSDPSRFSRKPRESRANNEIRFTVIERAADPLFQRPQVIAYVMGSITPAFANPSRRITQLSHRPQAWFPTGS